ncbi:MAG: hypothetical protein PHU80_03555, partial [Kiritimatiellae bacterium]|nr:hypothetical protein [Kiritimatiellia bacterium]
MIGIKQSRPLGGERPREPVKRHVRVAMRVLALIAASVVANGAVPAWRTGLLPSLSPFNALLA